MRTQEGQLKIIDLGIGDYVGKDFASKEEKSFVEARILDSFALFNLQKDFLRMQELFAKEQDNNFEVLLIEQIKDVFQKKQDLLSLINQLTNQGSIQFWAGRTESAAEELLRAMFQIAREKTQLRFVEFIALKNRVERALEGVEEKLSPVECGPGSISCVLSYFKDAEKKSIKLQELEDTQGIFSKLLEGKEYSAEEDKLVSVSAYKGSIDIDFHVTADLDLQEQIRYELSLLLNEDPRILKILPAIPKLPKPKKLMLSGLFKPVNLEEELNKAGLTNTEIDDLRKNSAGVMDVYEFLDKYSLSEPNKASRKTIALGLSTRRYLDLVSASGLQHFIDVHFFPTEKFLEKLANEGIEVVFFVPRGVRNLDISHLFTSQEFNWMLNNLNKIGKVTFVFGAYDMVDDAMLNDAELDISVYAIPEILRNYKKYKIEETAEKKGKAEFSCHTGSIDCAIPFIVKDPDKAVQELGRLENEQYLFSDLIIGEEPLPPNFVELRKDPKIAGLVEIIFHDNLLKHKGIFVGSFWPPDHKERIIAQKLSALFDTNQEIQDLFPEFYRIPERAEVEETPKEVPLESLLGKVTLEELIKATPYEHDRVQIEGISFERISSGIYGIVYKMTTPEKVYALKIFKEQLEGVFSRETDLSVQEEAINEYTAGSQGLEYLVKVYSKVTKDGKPVGLLEEFLEGRPLKFYTEAITSDTEAFPGMYMEVPDNAADNLEKAVESLASLERPISHNDLHRENILLLNDGIVKIIDLGRAIVHPTINADFAKRHLHDLEQAYEFISYLSLMKKSLKSVRDEKVDEAIKQEFKNIEAFRQRAVNRAKSLNEKVVQPSVIEQYLIEVQRTIDYWQMHLRDLAIERYGMSGEKFNKLKAQALKSEGMQEEKIKAICSPGSIECTISTDMPIEEVRLLAVQWLQKKREEGQGKLIDAANFKKQSERLELFTGEDWLVQAKKAGDNIELIIEIEGFESLAEEFEAYLNSNPQLEEKEEFDLTRLRVFYEERMKKSLKEFFGNQFDEIIVLARSPLSRRELEVEIKGVKEGKEIGIAQIKRFFSYSLMNKLEKIELSKIDSFSDQSGVGSKIYETERELLRDLNFDAKTTSTVTNPKTAYLQMKYYGATIQIHKDVHERMRHETDQEKVINTILNKEGEYVNALSRGFVFPERHIPEIIEDMKQSGYSDELIQKSLRAAGLEIKEKSKVTCGPGSMRCSFGLFDDADILVEELNNVELERNKFSMIAQDIFREQAKPPPALEHADKPLVYFENKDNAVFVVYNTHFDQSLKVIFEKKLDELLLEPELQNILKSPEENVKEKIKTTSQEKIKETPPWYTRAITWLFGWKTVDEIRAQLAQIPEQQVFTTQSLQEMLELYDFTDNGLSSFGLTLKQLKEKSRIMSIDEFLTNEEDYSGDYLLGRGGWNYEVIQSLKELKHFGEIYLEEFGSTKENTEEFMKVVTERKPNSIVFLVSSSHKGSAITEQELKYLLSNPEYLRRVTFVFIPKDFFNEAKAEELRKQVGAIGKGNAFAFYEALFLNYEEQTRRQAKEKTSLEQELSLSGLNSEQIRLLRTESSGVIDVEEYLQRIPEFKGDYGLGITNYRYAYVALTKLGGLVDWEEAYQDFFGNTEPKTGQFMNRLTSSDKKTVFFVPRNVFGYLDYSITKSELYWLLENPERMKNVVFVFGAYDLIPQERLKEIVSPFKEMDQIYGEVANELLKVGVEG
ncbi:protein kinase family protein, partial [archaeon]|nr:protein kinase family protein [archaeon]